MAFVLPSTQGRVREHSAREANARIRDDTLRRIGDYEHADAGRISARIAELEREWDIERVLEANAATVALVGLGLGATVDRRWFALPAVVAGFLLQHALQGWCPPLPLFRRFGVRTAREIHEEILALKLMRGDFDGPNTGADHAARKARLN
jgi:hypothetical protein